MWKQQSQETLPKWDIFKDSVVAILSNEVFQDFAVATRIFMKSIEVQQQNTTNV